MAISLSLLSQVSLDDAARLFVSRQSYLHLTSSSSSSSLTLTAGACLLQEHFLHEAFGNIESVEQ